jgi:hypothetical protein
MTAFFNRPSRLPLSKVLRCDGLGSADGSAAAAVVARANNDGSGSYERNFVMPPVAGIKVG